MVVNYHSCLLTYYYSAAPFISYDDSIICFVMIVLSVL
jgi:hypothetical protein